MKVVLWSPKGAGPHYGGPGRAAYTLYGALADRGVKASLVHGWPEQHSDDPAFASTHFLSELSSAKPAQARFILNGRRWLRRHAADYDVFHGIGGYHITLAPAAYACSLGLPAVVKLAMHRAELVRRPGLAGLLGLGVRRRKLLHRVAAVIAISSEIGDELLEYGVPASRIAHIPNGVDTKRFHPVTDAERRSRRAQLGLADLPTVLFVGALTPRKRPHLLVDACGAVRRRGLALQLVFVGPGCESPYGQELRARAEALGLAATTRFVGFVADPVPYTEAADVFVLPSAQEGLPNALAEAMAAGLAVVATPASGVRDLVAHGENGVVVGAEAGLTDALGELLGSAAERDRLGAHARSTIEARFSVDSVARAHADLFASLVR